MPKVNCAIYTRKSTEHGLDMEFNSLQNQEEACKAYILSQAFNGWEYYKTYSDGGISGGTMERPGLKTLLDDIRACEVQVVVVYKVDRLSRSIIDFHKMMQEFDKYGCNFVSITQSFDTSNSMGKLTLNMLLSFAQFEREVSAERVRDKIAASKAKGLWMGGTPPLGYDLKDKQLIPNPQEAELVNLIFNKYLELENMQAVAEWLNQKGYHTKAWIPRGGQSRGGKAFQKSSIQRILTNPIYIGKVAHYAKSKTYQGKHEPIIAKSMWDAVQDIIRRRITDPHAFSHYQTHKTALSGKLYDDKGQSFRLTSSKKQGKKFLYYYNGVGGHYLPAGQLDAFVLKTLKMTNFDELEPLADMQRLTDEQLARWITRAECQSIEKTHYLTVFLDEKQVRTDLSACPRISGQAEERTGVLHRLLDKIYVKSTFLVDNVSSAKLQNGTARNILTVRQLNESLVRGLARGWQLKRLLEKAKPLRECEKASGNKRTFARYLNLCYLSPRIVADILEYNNPRNMSLKELMHLAEGESDFERQEKVWSL